MPVADYAGGAPGAAPPISFPAMPPKAVLNTPHLGEMLVPHFQSFTDTAPDYSPSETLSFDFFQGLGAYVELPAGEIELALQSHYELLMLRVTEGGTGLPVAIETAIWNRERDREAGVMRSAEIDALRQDAAQGFYTPTGTAQARLFKVRTEYSNKIISLGRDIAIKQAQLELDNIQKALELIVPIEQEWIKYDLERRQRAFNLVKANNEVAVQVFDLTTKMFLANQEMRKLGVQIYQAEIAAYEAKIRAHVALIEAESKKLDVNKSLIDQFTAELSVNNMLLEAYKSEVSATVAEGELEALRVKMFEAEVSAYNSRIQAHVAKIQGKTAETQGWGEKVKAYQTEVMAYSTEVEAKAKEIEVQGTGIRLVQELNKAKLEAYKVEIEAMSAKSQAEIGFATVNNQSNSVHSSAIASYNNIQAQVWGAASQAHISAQTVLSQTQKMNLDLLQAQKAMVLDAGKTSAQTYAQLISSYLNQQHYQVGVSGTASLGASLTESHGYEEKAANP